MSAARDVGAANHTVRIEIDSEKLRRLVERFRQRQNLPMGIIAGTGAGALGAFLWGAIVGITGLQYELEWVPMIGIGFLVGTAVRLFGRGIDRVFAVTGALLALVASVVGSLWATAIAVAWQLRDVSNFLLFTHADLETWCRLFVAGTGWLDLAILAFTLWEAYALSRIRLSDTQLATLAPRGAFS